MNAQHRQPRPQPGHDPGQPEQSLPANDHRRLGRELELFASDPLLPVGMPIWLPNGAVIREQLERYIVDAERAAGYQHVYSPPLGRKEMYEISGHWDHYAESMFPPINDGPPGPDGRPSDSQQLVLRPMNCPHHIVAYRSRPRSWRELPLRIAEIGAMFRNENSGALSGLSRVRAMALNDAHHFIDPDGAEHGIAAEVALVVSMISDAYAALGLSGHHFRLSLRGPGEKYVADDDLWQRAEHALAGALEDLNVPYEAVPGEAAFYGPKIDVQMPGRALDGQAPRVESFSSVQLDFHLPAQFELEYAGPHGPRRPVMVHRSVISSLERCLSFLLEQSGGNLPVWLAPAQAVVLPVNPSDGAHVAAAHQAAAAARRAGLRVEVSEADEPLGARVRKARLARAPYRLVIGDREAAGGDVAVSVRDGRNLGAVPVAEFVARAAAVASARGLELWPAG